MTFLKDLIGKKVVSCEGKILGYTRAPLFSENFKRICALLCADEDEEDFILPLSRRQKVDDVFLMPRQKRQNVTGMPYSPLLKQAYSAQGKLLGVVEDVQLEEFKISALIIDGKKYAADKVKAFGDCVLINDSPTPLRKTKRKEKILLGKVLKFDVFSQDGDVLFTKGTLITPQILKTAALKKRLLELTAKTLAR